MCVRFENRSAFGEDINGQHYVVTFLNLFDRRVALFSESPCRSGCRCGLSDITLVSASQRSCATSSPVST